MLQVLLARLRYFFTLLIYCEWFHARAQQCLAGQKRRIRLPMGEHNHVAVVNAVVLLAMLVLVLTDESPVQG